MKKHECLICSLMILLAACSMRSNSYGILRFPKHKAVAYAREKPRKIILPGKNKAEVVANNEHANASVSPAMTISSSAMINDEVSAHPKTVHHELKSSQVMKYDARPVSVSSGRDVTNTKNELSEDWWAVFAFVILIGAIVAYGILFLVALTPYVYTIMNGVGLLSIVVGDILLSVSNKRTARGRNKRTFFNKASNLLSRLIAIVFLAVLLYYVISLLF